MMKKMIKNKVKGNSSIPKSTTGFAMLFAVLASSLLMALGISMFGISIKEIQIATSERDSQIAYYAADSARECAIYTDIAKRPLVTCDPSLSPILTSCPLSVTSIITCNGSSTPLTFNRNPSSPGFIYNLSGQTTFFYYSTSTSSITEPDGGIIMLQKTFSSGGGSINQIDSFGHNTGIVGRRVKRSISTEY